MLPAVVVGGEGPSIDGRARELAVARARAADDRALELVGSAASGEGPILCARAVRPPARGAVVIATPPGFVLGGHAVEAALSRGLPPGGWDTCSLQMPLAPAADVPDGGAAAARISFALGRSGAGDAPLFAVVFGPQLDVVLAATKDRSLAGIVAIDPVAAPEEGGTAPADPPGAGDENAPRDAAPADSAAERQAARLRRYRTPVMLVTTAAAVPADHAALVRVLHAAGDLEFRSLHLPELGPDATGLESGLTQRVLGFLHHLAGPPAGAGLP